MKALLIAAIVASLPACAHFDYHSYGPIDLRAELHITTYGMDHVCDGCIIRVDNNGMLLKIGKVDADVNVDSIKATGGILGTIAGDALQAYTGGSGAAVGGAASAGADLLRLKFEHETAQAEGK